MNKLVAAVVAVNVCAPVFLSAPVLAEQGTIEEIVVTAQKREESLQDTPISVTAFISQDITDRQIDGVRKIAQMAPSLVFNQSGGAANTYLRGVGQDISTVLGEPGVARHRDGRGVRTQ